MRRLIGAGTPREAAARGLAYLFFVDTEDAVAIILVAASPDGFAVLVVAVSADPAWSKRDFSNGLIRTFVGSQHDTTASPKTSSPPSVSPLTLSYWL
jgi:hypothetical protein